VTGHDALVIAHQSRPKSGETANGDAIVVKRYPDGALVAIVDALGHGPRAEAVAKQAHDHIMETYAAFPEEDAVGVMKRLHSALRGTRGACATICLIRGRALEACGVGNVEMRCVGVSVPVVLTPGIVGVQLRNPRAFSGALPPSARCFLFSDGVSRRAPFSELSKLSPLDACQALMRKHRHSHDDASVIVVAAKEPDR
jgi:negative regulator of sigma-B (phosphoserine phosphatase)